MENVNICQKNHEYCQDVIVTIRTPIINIDYQESLFSALLLPIAAEESIEVIAFDVENEDHSQGENVL